MKKSGKKEKTLRHHDLNPRLIIWEMTNLPPSFLFIADQLWSLFVLNHSCKHAIQPASTEMEKPPRHRPSPAMSARPPARDLFRRWRTYHQAFCSLLTNFGIYLFWTIPVGTPFNQPLQKWKNRHITGRAPPCPPALEPLWKWTKV
jgi:hypothetical protein